MTRMGGGTYVYTTGMTFMVIEHFKDRQAVAERFRASGRMLPDGLAYHASWIDPASNRCFQVMEATGADRFVPWTAAWADIVDFEIIPVLTSAEFWTLVQQPRPPEP
jgi:uncharacterized protein DUF3303